ncbi:hypothetical protein DOTSEDRAFT_121192 [Dothistroma septosporum NZE10]|uniref:Rhodopsin domain-containing protein n=1 Tax=Dothistroma septosporum (strain NZE10 / CBS 128990) TaxID=675120 RepID=N1PY32_DOTSN|nr:hypothetical protein DOTSEDRAFT_121192 [Dothistroma septosporum NZE10]
MKASGHASGAAVIATTLTGSILFYIACGLRLYTRIYIVRQPWWDDALIAISVVFVSRHTPILTCTDQATASYGLGKHVEEVPPDRLKTMLFWFWLSIWNYYCAQGFAKLSILLQYQRIFGHVKKFRIACYCVIASVVFYIVWGSFSTAFYCFPASGFWHPEAVAEGKAHCQAQWTVKVPIWFFNAALNMATDIAIAVLPLPVIKSLNLPRKQRISLMFVFGIGGFIIIISIIRLSGLYAIAVSHDPTYDNPLAAIWSATEANLTGLASCLPVLKGMIAKFFPSLIKASYAASNQPYGNSGQMHSKLSEKGARKSAAVWGKKETEINIEETTVCGSSDSPDMRSGGGWGWEEEKRSDAIEMETIVEAGKKTYPRRDTAGSEEHLVEVLPAERA